MIVVINVSKYKDKFFLFGIFSMVVFNIILFFRRGKPKFIKLLGSGKNGTFDIVPDFNTWAFLGTWQDVPDYEKFLKTSRFKRYIEKFSTENYALVLNCTMAHGQWDGINPFVSISQKGQDNLPVGVLTRATIRWSKLRQFWQNVPEVAKDLEKNEDLYIQLELAKYPSLNKQHSRFGRMKKR